MTLDQEIIRTRCQEISESVERLEKIRNNTKDEFLKNQDTKDIASYRLLVAIEAALGICSLLDCWDLTPRSPSPPV